MTAYEMKIPTHTTVSVDTDSTVVSAANRARTHLTIVNVSDEDVYLSLGGTPVVGTGIFLPANGGLYEIGEANWTHLAVNGICASGGKTVIVLPDTFGLKSAAGSSTVMNWPVDSVSNPVHQVLADIAAATYHYPAAAGFEMIGSRHGALQYDLNDCSLEVQARNHAGLGWTTITHGAWDSRTGGNATRVVGGVGLAVEGVLFFDLLNVGMVRVEIITPDATNQVHIDWRNIP